MKLIKYAEQPYERYWEPEDDDWDPWTMVIGAAILVAFVAWILC